MKLIILLLFIFLPILIIRRMVKNPRGTILNPLFYLVVFSYIYLLLPSLYIDYAIYDVFKLKISKDSFAESQFLCIWYVVIFSIFFYFSKSEIIKFGEKPSILSYQISLFFYIIITLLFVYIIVVDVPRILPFRSNRIIALEIFTNLILNKYKLQIVLLIFFCLTTVLILYSHKLLYLLPLILIMVMDFSHGGRTLTFMVVLYAYIMIVLETGRLYIKFLLISILGMALLGFLQRNTYNNMIWSLYMFVAEFTNTRITTTILLNNETLRGDFWEHFVIAVTKFIPGGFIQQYFRPGELWYGEQIYKYANVNYGLAGNLISESLFYGGRLFAYLTPFILGSFYLLLNNLKSYRYLIGLLYIILLATKSQDMMRSYSYEYYMFFIQFIIVLFFLYPDYKKRVLIKK